MIPVVTLAKAFQRIADISYTNTEIAIGGADANHLCLAVSHKERSDWDWGSHPVYLSWEDVLDDTKDLTRLVMDSWLAEEYPK